MTTASGSRATSAPGSALEKILDRDLALLSQPSLRIGDAPVQLLAAERLRLDQDAAELAVFEAALLLHRPEQLLVVEVAVAEVVAEDDPGEELTVDPDVVLEAIDRPGHQHRVDAAVQVHQPEPHHPAQHRDAFAAVVADPL